MCEPARSRVDLAQAAVCDAARAIARANPVSYTLGALVGWALATLGALARSSSAYSLMTRAVTHAGLDTPFLH